MNSVIRKGLNSNLHFIGVILFFILHGYARNYPLVPIGSLLLLLFELLVAGFVLYRINGKIIGAPLKASLFTAFILTLYLFFVPFQNFFAAYKFSASIGKVTFLLPVCIIAIVIVGIWLKKSHRKFVRSSRFVNTLLAVYLVVECGIIIGNIISPSFTNNRSLNKYQVTICDTCKKIPVYLIISDEHVGFDAEQQFLDYYDTSFAGFLRNEGFYLVQHPRSNYAVTIYSMSSLLNMRYHEANMKPLEYSNHFAYNAAHEAIRDNAVCDFFKKQGYRIVNNSIFDLKDAPAGNTSELPSSIQLITNQTMYYAAVKHLLHALDERVYLSWVSHKLEDETVNGNEVIMERTLDQAKKGSPQPTFTYVHLLMPHAPFAYDSIGRRTYHTPIDKDNYLQYLVYTDKRLTGFIRQLKQATKGQAAIMLMGDHGVRIWLKNSLEEPFMPLCAIYLPQKNYEGWYPGISHVNQFRVLFNTLFHQSLPILPDSTSWGK